MSRLTVRWNEIARADWDLAHGRAGASYQQDWAYATALRRASPGLGLARAEVVAGDCRRIAIAQATIRSFGPLARFALCTHGPVWTGPVDAETKAAAYRALRRSFPARWPKLLVFTPDEALGPDAGLAGLNRVMTGDATVLIDLRQDEDRLRQGLEPSWRNKLAKAERSPLSVQRSGVKPAQYRWLLEAETRQRQSRGYRAMPLSLTETWQEEKAEAAGGEKGTGLLVVRADLGRDAAAGMLFLIHGSRATYHVGWTGDAGREHAAHNLILWTAMRDLKARGVTELDLGGVNTQSGAGIARFKLETGGRVLIRAGAYV